MTSPFTGFMFDVKPTRVSLVKRPANKRKFLVTKSQEEEKMDFSEIIQIIQKTEADNEEALVEVLQSAEKDEGTIQAAVSIYRTLSAFADSLDGDDLVAIGKALSPKVTEEVEEVVEEAVEKEETEEVVEKADESEEVTEEVEETVEKTEEETEEVTETEETEEVHKSDTDEQIETLHNKIASLEADRRRNELRDMVKGLRVGKDEDTLVEILMDIDKADGDVAPIVETWKTASDSVLQALTEIGSELPGIVSKNVYAEAEAEVARIAKDEGVSIASAWKLLGDRNPALIKKYYDEEK